MCAAGVTVVAPTTLNGVLPLPCMPVQCFAAAVSDCSYSRVVTCPGSARHVNLLLSGPLLNLTVVSAAQVRKALAAQHHAATVIQSRWRCATTHGAFQLQRQAAITIQAAARRLLVLKQYCRVQGAAAAVQVRIPISFLCWLLFGEQSQLLLHS
jgi:hypothetical protein